MQPAAKGQNGRCQSVAEQKPQGHIATFGQQVGHIQFRDDPADRAALVVQGCRHPQHRITGHPHRFGGNRSAFEIPCVRADRRAARVGCGQHMFAFICHHCQQQPLPFAACPGAVEDIVYFPDILPQDRRPKGDRQAFDMQPRRLGQPRVLYPAKGRKHALAGQQTQQDHQRRRDQRHAQGDGEIAKPLEGFHPSPRTAMRAAMPSNSQGSAAMTLSRNRSRNTAWP